MSFEYGSDALEIRNPFKIESKVLLVTGILVVVSGFAAFGSVPAAKQIAKVIAWISVFYGIAIIAWGVRLCIRGAFGLSKLNIGRTAPTSLAPDREPGRNSREDCAYNAGQVRQMISSRTNVTFEDPSNLLQRLLYSKMPSLICTPPPIQRILATLTNTGKMIGVSLCSLILLSYLVHMELFGELGGRFLPVISFVALAAIAFVMTRMAGFDRTPAFQKTVSVFTGAILTMAGMRVFLAIKYGFPGYMNLFNAWPTVVIFLLAVVASMYFTILLITTRKYDLVTTEASEHRNTSQESIHPNDVMTHLEKVILAARRHKKIPNRVYADFGANLVREDIAKGQFSGLSLIETQPEYLELERSPEFTSALMATTISSAVCSVLAAISLTAAIYTGLNSNNGLTLTYTLLFAFFALFGAGEFLHEVAHTFWSETYFKSTLYMADLAGTYTESELSVGKGLYDSTGSKNKIVRSSITTWLMCSDIVSSTFARVGTNPFAGKRYVFDLKKNDFELEKLKSEINDFLSTRKNIANLTEQDRDAMKSIDDLNQESGVYKNRAMSPEALNSSGEQPELIELHPPSA